MTKLSLVCYHYLAREDEFAKIRGHTLRQFRQHLDFFKTNFRIAQATELLSGPKSGGKTNLLITFDDALKEHAKTFAPLLEKEGISGVFSVPTCILRGEPANPQIIRFAESYYGPVQFYNFVISEIGSVSPENRNFLVERPEVMDSALFEKHIKSLFKFKLPVRVARQILLNLYNKYLLPKFPDFMKRVYLNEKDIKDLSRANHVIAVHSDTHPVIGRIKPDDTKLFTAEIITPKKDLENLLREQVSIFTYPHGQKEEVFEDPRILREAGYKLVFTTFQQNPSFNPLAVGRYQSYTADTIATLKENIWSYDL